MGAHRHGARRSASSSSRSILATTPRTQRRSWSSTPPPAPPLIRTATRITPRARPPARCSPRGCFRRGRASHHRHRRAGARPPAGPDPRARSGPRSASRPRRGPRPASPRATRPPPSPAWRTPSPAPTVVCMATPATEPVLRRGISRRARRAWTRSATRPAGRELDPALVREALAWSSSRVRLARRPPAHRPRGGGGRDQLASSVSAGRAARAPSSSTLYMPVGVALREDDAAAALALRGAEELELVPLRRRSQPSLRASAPAAPTSRRHDHEHRHGLGEGSNGPHMLIVAADELDAGTLDSGQHPAHQPIELAGPHLVAPPPQPVLTAPITRNSSIGVRCHLDRGLSAPCPSDTPSPAQVRGDP